MELSGAHFHLFKEDVELTTSFVQDYTLLHHQKSILLGMLFKFFSVTTSSMKYCLVQTCKVDGLAHNGTLYKGKILGFCWCFAPFRSRKTLDLVTQLFLNPKQNPTYRATFGVNRFENILRHLRFDNKRTQAERLKQDKLAAFHYTWSLFIQNCKTQFFLGAFTNVDEQLMSFRGTCPS